MNLPLFKTNIFVIFMLCFICAFSIEIKAQNSQPKKIRSVQFQRAQVVSQDAAVYAKPDFDSEVTYVLELGDQFDISMNVRGPFYRIILDRKNKIYGWIADNDIVPLSKLKKSKAQENKKKVEEKSDLFSQEEDADDEYANYRKIDKLLNQRWIGPQVSFVNYTEDTMRRLRSEIIPFFGIKLYGANSLFSGPIVIESNLLFAKAPKYYRKVTNEKADGILGIVDFNFQQQLPISVNQVWSYGFGPLLKYSDLKLNLNDKTYKAQDIILGANFNLGTLYSFKSFALRSDLKFIIEKKNYFSFSVGVLLPY